MHDDFKNRLRHRREELGIAQSELADRIEISRSQVCSWEAGRNLPKTPVLVKLARVLDTSTDYLLGLAIERGSASRDAEGPKDPVTGAIEDSRKSLRRLLSLLDEAVRPELVRPELIPGRVVPIYGPVSAGHPHEALSPLDERITVPENWLPRREKGFVLKVSGDSMAPILEHGDLAVVREQSEVKPGEIVVAYIHGEPLVKRLVKEKKGYVLRADSGVVESIPVGRGVEIKGKVIGFMRHLKRHTGM